MLHILAQSHLRVGCQRFGHSKLKMLRLLRRRRPRHLWRISSLNIRWVSRQALPEDIFSFQEDLKVPTPPKPPQVPHTPVMVEEVLDALQEGVDAQDNDNVTILDATVGTGAHAKAILERFPHSTVVGIDRDPEMVKQAAAMLAPFGSRAIVLQGSFGYLQRALARVNGGPVAGILFDLGMNSLHVDTSIRGFSYRRDGPLDMRVDPTTLPATAANLVSKLDFPDLKRMFEEWGEEPLAPVIAQAIVEWRGIGRRRRAIHSTLELRHIIEMAVDVHYNLDPRNAADRSSSRGLLRHDKNRAWLDRKSRETQLRRLAERRPRHAEVLQRCFQALRIAVNDEHTHVQRAIQAAEQAIAPNGSLVVLSFQPTEDRLVGHALQHDRWVARAGPEVVRPSKDEVRRNRRARSAHLRLWSRTEEQPEAAEEGEEVSESGVARSRRVVSTSLPLPQVSWAVRRWRQTVQRKRMQRREHKRDFRDSQVTQRHEELVQLGGKDSLEGQVVRLGADGYPVDPER